MMQSHGDVGPVFVNLSIGALTAHRRFLYLEEAYMIHMGVATILILPEWILTRAQLALPYE